MFLQCACKNPSLLHEYFPQSTHYPQGALEKEIFILSFTRKFYVKYLLHQDLCSLEDMHEKVWSGSQVLFSALPQHDVWGLNQCTDFCTSFSTVVYAPDALKMAFSLHGAFIKHCYLSWLLLLSMICVSDL